MTDKEYLEKYQEKYGILKEEDFDKLTIEEIISLYDNKEIKFLDRYDKKFKEKYYDKINC